MYPFVILWIDMRTNYAPDSIAGSEAHHRLRLSAPSSGSSQSSGQLRKMLNEIATNCKIFSGGKEEAKMKYQGSEGGCPKEVT